MMGSAPIVNKAILVRVSCLYTTLLHFLTTLNDTHFETEGVKKLVHVEHRLVNHLHQSNL